MSLVDELGISNKLSLLQQGMNIFFSPQDLVEGEKFCAEQWQKFVSGPKPATFTEFVMQIIAERDEKRC